MMYKPKRRRVVFFFQATERSGIASAANSFKENLQADQGAPYDEVIEIDLDQLQPHINGPFTPDLAHSVGTEFSAAVKVRGRESAHDTGRWRGGGGGSGNDRSGCVGDNVVYDGDVVDGSVDDGSCWLEAIFRPGVGGGATGGIAMYLYSGRGAFQGFGGGHGGWNGGGGGSVQ